MAARPGKPWTSFRPTAPVSTTPSSQTRHGSESARTANSASLRPALKPANSNGSHEQTSVDRFQSISQQHQAVITKRLAQIQNTYGDLSSSDEDEPLEKRTEILDTIVKSYTSSRVAGDEDDRAVLRTLENATAGAWTCLICISTIKKTDPIWNCTNCCASLHLNCIQKWAKDGVIRTSSFLSDNLFPDKDKFWACPRCRFEYSVRDTPTRYYCFCGKTPDPEGDPWILPHSCGQTCEKTLKSGCSHKCLLLCHPGPCPPCPAQCKISCYCGQQQRMVRCGGKTWGCDRTCGKSLDCGRHKCEQKCHPGECSPCSKKINMKCACGSESGLQLCSVHEWHCTRVCGKKFVCGLHSCGKTCHSGSCGPCVRSLPRSCPCGKTKSVSDCSVEVSPCGSTCEKPVCPLHFCQDVCHVGDCGPCTETIKKTCPCGAKTKQLPCSKTFICDTKCKSQRNCGRHPCNKRCCSGNCPACDQVCGRMLNCRNHKCESPCHPGLCYPCTQSVDIACACGRTRNNVPCGRQRSAKPPKCSVNCDMPPECHHPARIPHHCHFGRCPPCVQICREALSCGHQCQLKCHSAVEVLVRSDKERPAGPWELKTTPDLEIHEYPCPPCEAIVMVPCLGGHDEAPQTCYQKSVMSCGRPCGRKLECGNHVCTMACHSVENPKDLIKCDTSCDECSSLCSFKKPCGHPCVLACHRGECPACPETVRIKCHCQGMTLKFSCGKVTRLSPAEKVDLFSCKVQCPVLMTCGHPCTLLCHPSDQSHSLSTECKKKCPLKCPCGRLKEQLPCHKIAAGFKLVCDDECRKIADVKRQEEELKAQQDREMKEKEEADLQSQLDKKRGKKRPRNRNWQEEENTSFIKEHWPKFLLVAAVVAALAYIMHSRIF